MKTKLVSLILALLSLSPYAETTIGTHVRSIHNKPGFNNSNPGLYIVHNGWTIGSYYNSERRQSTYAGYTYYTKLIDVTAIVITGYNKPVVPALIPSKVFMINNIGIRTSLLINPLQGGASAAHISLEMKL